MAIAAQQTLSPSARINASPDQSGTRRALGPNGDAVGWQTLLGPSLDDLLHSAPDMPLAVQLRVLFDIVSAVAERHSNSNAPTAARCQGHVTPADIVVGMNGVAQLSSVKKDLRKTKLPLQPRRGYLAPELLLRKYPASRAADVFALGVCLWELLASRRLFTEHKAQELFDQIRSHEFAVEADLPGEAWALLMVAEKAFSYHPKNRYESASQMLADMYYAAGDLLATHAAVADYVQSQTGLIPRLFEPPSNLSDSFGPPTELSSRCAADVHPTPLNFPRPPAMPSLQEMEALSGLVFTDQPAAPQSNPSAAADSAEPELPAAAEAPDSLSSELLTLVPEPTVTPGGEDGRKSSLPAWRGELTTIAETTVVGASSKPRTPVTASGSRQPSPVETSGRRASLDPKKPRRPRSAEVASRRTSKVRRDTHEPLAAAVSITCTVLLLVTTVWLACQ